MTEEKNKPFSELFDFAKKFSGFFISFIGFITSFSAFIQAWKTIPTTYTWIFSIGGSFIAFAVLAWITLSWKKITTTIPGDKEDYQLIRKEKRFPPKWRNVAKISLFILFLATLGAGYKTYQKRMELDEKLVVLVTQLHELNDNCDTSGHRSGFMN